MFHADDTFKIDLVGVDPARRANLLANLRSDLLAAGLERESVVYAPSDKETMSLSAALLVGLGTLGWEALRSGAHAFGSQTGKMLAAKIPVVFDTIVKTFQARHHVALRIQEPGGEIIQYGEASGCQNALAPVDFGEIGIILLGASDYPHAPTLSNSRFAQSARMARELFSTHYMNFNSVRCLDLFDVDITPMNLSQQVEAFLDSNIDCRDILMYYCGHGEFLNDMTYVLTLKGTRERRKSYTTLQLKQFRDDLEDKLAQRRFYMILDCCYAASAVKQFMGPDASHHIGAQWKDELPPAGWAILAASSANKVAIAPEGESCTMFTGVLASVLRLSSSSQKDKSYSLSELGNLTRQAIKSRWGQRAVAPETHVPLQTAGDVSALPIFRGSPRETGASAGQITQRMTLDVAIPEAVTELPLPPQQAKTQLVAPQAAGGQKTGIKQRAAVRQFLRDFGYNKQRVCAAYAAADNSGEVIRVRNKYNMCAEDYAIALWNDGHRQDRPWILEFCRENGIHTDQD